MEAVVRLVEECKTICGPCGDRFTLTVVTTGEYVDLTLLDIDVAAQVEASALVDTCTYVTVIARLPVLF